MSRTETDCLFKARRCIHIFVLSFRRFCGTNKTRQKCALMILWVADGGGVLQVSLSLTDRSRQGRTQKSPSFDIAMNSGAVVDRGLSHVFTSQTTGYCAARSRLPYIGRHDTYIHIIGRRQADQRPLGKAAYTQAFRLLLQMK